MYLYKVYYRVYCFSLESVVGITDLFPSGSSSALPSFAKLLAWEGKRIHITNLSACFSFTFPITSECSCCRFFSSLFLRVALFFRRWPAEMPCCGGGCGAQAASFRGNAGGPCAAAPSPQHGQTPHLSSPAAFCVSFSLFPYFSIQGLPAVLDWWDLCRFLGSASHLSLGFLSPYRMLLTRARDLSV